MPKHTHLLIGGPHDGARVDTDQADPDTIPMFDLSAKPEITLQLVGSIRRNDATLDVPRKHFYVRKDITLGGKDAVVYVHEFYIGHVLESLLAGYRKP
jgi:hypothetical protein